MIVLDADHEPTGGPAKRWKEVLTILRETGFAIPDEVSIENGLICDLDDKRRIAVWLFPDCKSSGALEEFMLQGLIPATDHCCRTHETSFATFENGDFPRSTTEKLSFVRGFRGKNVLVCPRDVPLRRKSSFPTRPDSALS